MGTQHSLPTLAPNSIPSDPCSTASLAPDSLLAPPSLFTCKGSALAGPPSRTFLLAPTPRWKPLSTQISFYHPLSTKPPPNILLKVVLLPPHPPHDCLSNLPPSPGPHQKHLVFQLCRVYHSFSLVQSLSRVRLFATP